MNIKKNVVFRKMSNNSIEKIAILESEGILLKLSMMSKLVKEEVVEYLSRKQLMNT